MSNALLVLPFRWNSKDVDQWFHVIDVEKYRKVAAQVKVSVISTEHSLIALKTLLVKVNVVFNPER